MPKITINGVDRSTSYTPAQIAAIGIRQIAFDGEVGQGSIPIPDPDGTYAVYAGQPVLIEDGAETVIDAFVGGIDRDRGEGAIGPRRAVTHVLPDENALLNGFRAAPWSRPAESTRARFLAFLAAFVPEVTDTTWVLNTHTATMPKKRYMTESLFTDLQQEIADLTGNTAFIEGRRAHLHLPTQGPVSTLAVSDVAWDFVTTFPPESPSMTKDPHDLGNDVMVRTPQGSTTKTDATSISRHDVGGLKHQRLVELDSGDSGARNAKATAILADSRNERTTYECDIGPLTAAQVNEIPPGALMNVTSQVMGLTSSTQRIAARTLTYHHPGNWYAHLEFGFPIRIRVKPPRTMPPLLEPFRPCDPADFLVGTEAGDIACIIPSGSDPLACYSDDAPGGGRIFLYGGATYRIQWVVDHANSTRLTASLVGVDGSPVVASHDMGGNVPDHQPPIHLAEDIFTVPAGYTKRYEVWLQDVTYVGFDGTGASVSAVVSYVSGSDPRFTDLACDRVPALGQPVNNESVAGAAAGTTFTANHPYLPGSLRILVPAGVIPTEIDPAAGTFSLPVDTTGQTVVFSYQGTGGDPIAGQSNPTSGAAVYSSGGSCSCGETGNQDYALAAEVVKLTTGGAPTVVQAVTVSDQLAAVLVDSGDGWVAPTAGNLLVYWHSARSLKTPAAPTGWTQHPLGTVDGNNDRGSMFYKISDGTEASIQTVLPDPNRNIATFVEIAGVLSLDANAETTGSSTAITTGSVTPTAGRPGIIIGGAVINTSDSPQSVTPGSGWTELADSMVDEGLEGGFHPLHWMAYQAVPATAGSYDPSGTASASAPFGGQTLAFVSVASEWTAPAPAAVDGSDASFETIAGTDLLRADLQSPFSIARSRLRVGVATAGPRTYTIKGANAEDFSDEVTLDTVAFTGIGSLTAQDVEFLWIPATAYRFYELSGDDTNQRIFAWELYQAAAGDVVVTDPTTSEAAQLQDALDNIYNPLTWEVLVDGTGSVLLDGVGGILRQEVQY